MKKINCIFLLCLLLAGCSFVEIVNFSDLSARVRVQVPDSGSGYTRHVGPGRVAEVFSSHGGRYTVTALPDEEYRQLLLTIREDVTQRLFNEGATLTAAEVGELVNVLNTIDARLEELSTQFASCSGNVPEFETVTVTMSWDFDTSNWILICG